MGLFSSIKKLTKKIFKGIKKHVKRVFKAVKKFAKSKFGKILLAAAAIYFGGAALGAWGGQGATAATQLASTTIAPVGAEATAAGLQAAAGASTTAATAAGGAATVEGAAASQTLWGTLKGKAGEIGGWMEKHPVLTKAAGTVMSSVFSEDPETEEDRIKARQRASNIAGVDYSGRGEPLTVGLLRRSNQLPEQETIEGASNYG